MCAGVLQHLEPKLREDGEEVIKNGGLYSFVRLKLGYVGEDIDFNRQAIGTGI